MMFAMLFILIHLCIGLILIKSTKLLNRLPLLIEIPAMSTIIFVWVKFFGLSIIVYDLLLVIGI